MQATTPEDNSSFFQRKRRAASGGTRTRDLLRSRQMHIKGCSTSSLHYMQAEGGLAYLTVDLPELASCSGTKVDATARTRRLAKRA